MMLKIFRNALGVSICIVISGCLFILLCSNEVVNPTWVKKVTHTTKHIRPDYTVTTKVIRYVPMLNGIFGYGEDTEETVRYSK